MRPALFCAVFLTLITCIINAQDAEGYAQKALESIQAGDLNKTVLYAEKSAALFESEGWFPEDYYAVLFIGGKAYNGLGRPDDARKLLERGSNRIQTEPSLIFGLLINELGLAYKTLGDLQTAVSLFRRGLGIFGKTGDEGKRFAGITTYNIALCEMSAGNYKEGLSSLKKAEQAISETGGNEDPMYPLIFNLYGLYHYYTGNFTEAESYYNRALSLHKKISGTDTYEYATTLNNLAQLYLQQSKYAEAEIYTKNALRIYTKTIGVKHPDYIISVNNLGLIYRYLERFAGAESLYQFSADLNKELFGDKSPQYALSLNNLADLYLYLGDYKLAESYFTTAVNIYADMYGTENPDYLRGLSNLGLLYNAKGDYTKAEALFRKVIEVRQKILGLTHPDYATSLNNLGMCLFNLGRYREAEDLLNRSLAVYKMNFGEYHTNYAMALGNLAQLYSTSGNYKAAEELLLKSLEIREKIHGKHHSNYALGLTSLGQLYYLTGDYAKSEFYYQSALDLTESITGKNHVSYAANLASMAKLWFALGNFKKAFEFMDEAIEIYKRLNAVKQLDYAMTLNSFGEMLVQAAYFDDAEKYFTEALQLVKESVGTKHNFYATCLNGLGLTYSFSGRPEKAQKYYAEALEIIKEQFGTQNHNYLLLNNNLSLTYSLLQDYDNALKYIKEAYETGKEVLGENHPDVILSMINMADIMMAKGDNEDAEKVVTDMFTIKQNMARKLLPALSESEKADFLTKDDYIYDMAFSFSSASDPVNYKDIYEKALFRKGLLLNSSTGTRAFITRSGDENLKKKYSEWLNVKQLLSGLYNLTAVQRAASGYDTDSLEQLANTLEKEISGLSASFRDFVLVPDVKWTELRDNLREGDILLDFNKFRFYNGKWTDSVRYGVFITRFDSEAGPEYFEFGDGIKLDTLIIPALNRINQMPSAPQADEDDDKVIVLNETPSAQTEIYEEIFAPLLKYLTGIRRIYICADGDFHKVNFGTILNPATGKYLIEDYEFLRIPTPVSVLRKQDKKEINRTAVLFGYPDYNMTTPGVTEALAKTEPAAAPDIYVNADETRGSGFGLLPGTKEETETVAALLRENGWKAEVFLFDNAVESKIKQVNAPGILTVSTHGYFSPAPGKNYTESRLMGIETAKAAENPLLRSGLLLAGAQSFLNASEDEKSRFRENGILTAFEASQLNLYGTDLVILSACETGLGEVNNGEGVFGLQRGFLLSGAGSVLMSLWKVDDKATKELIVEFMKNYIKGESKSTALRNAQLKLMKTMPSPYYWGAFVLVGM